MEMGKGNASKTKMPKDRKKSLAPPKKEEEQQKEEAQKEEEIVEEMIQEIEAQPEEEPPKEDTFKTDTLNEFLHLIISSWSGPCEGAIPNGFGQMILRSGAVYEGDVAFGRLHGKGTLKLPNGWTFEGDFVQNSIQGSGRICFPDGGEYEGEVAAGYRHGEGVFRLGEITYQGFWKAGKKHGEGRCQWNEKSFYEGSWKNGLCEGYGERRWGNDDLYVGEWKNGKRHGQGKMILVDAEQSYEGEWKNGIQCGHGTAKWHGVRNAEYTGSWKNGQRDGIGAMTYGDGSYYNGEWKEDKKWGEAEVVSTNGYKEVPILFEDDRIVDQFDNGETFYSITESQLDSTLGELLAAGKTGIIRNIGQIRHLYSTYSENNVFRLMHFDRLCVDYGIVKLHPIEGFYSENIKDPMRPLLLREFAWFLVNTARVLFTRQKLDDGIQYLLDGMLLKPVKIPYRELYKIEICKMREGLSRIWAAHDYGMSGRDFLLFLKKIKSPFSPTQVVKIMCRDDPVMEEDIDRSISFIQFANALIGLIIEERNPPEDVPEPEVAPPPPVTAPIEKSVRINPDPPLESKLDSDMSRTTLEEGRASQDNHSELEEQPRNQLDTPDSNIETEPIQNRRCTVKPPSRISGEFNNPERDDEENIPIKSISSISNNKLEKTISNLTQTATTGLKSGSLLQTISDMSENRVKSGDSVGRSVISSASVMTEIVDYFNEQILSPWIEFEQVEEIMQEMEEKRKEAKNVKLIELVNVRSHIQSLSLISLKSETNQTEVS